MLENKEVIPGFAPKLPHTTSLYQVLYFKSSSLCWMLLANKQMQMKT